MPDTIIIYTDGASRGNPGKAGWAGIIFFGNKVLEIAGREELATNNRMEMMAVKKTLSETMVKSFKGRVVVYCDSAYTINGITKWVKGWQKNDWLTSAKTKVENKELWVELSELYESFEGRISFEKVKGHSGDLYNDRCDELATGSALGQRNDLYIGNLDEYQNFLKNRTDQSVGLKKIKKSEVKKTVDKRPAYSYVSLVDGKVFADKTWALCSNRVRGKKGAKYKKVFSKDEERDLIQDYTLSSLL